MFCGEDGRIEIKETATTGKVLTKDSKKKILALLTDIPTGVYKMSEDIEGLVETSLNVATCECCEDSFSLTVSIRSSKGNEKAALYGKVKDIAAERGATVLPRGEYPGWEYKKDSLLRDVMCRVWKRMYKNDAEVVMIHAGLECGIFSDKLSGLDCVSTGPNHFDIHTPGERLSLSSTERVWDFLLEVFKEL